LNIKVLLSLTFFRETLPLAAVATAFAGATTEPFSREATLRSGKVCSDHNLRDLCIQVIFWIFFFFRIYTLFSLLDRQTSVVFPGSKIFTVSFSVADLDLFPCCIFLCV